MRKTNNDMEEWASVGGSKQSVVEAKQTRGEAHLASGLYLEKRGRRDTGSDVTEAHGSLQQLPYGRFLGRKVQHLI